MRRGQRSLRARAVAAILGVAAVGSLSSSTVDEGAVLLVPLEGAITPVLADFAADSVAEAEAGGYQALVMTLDTPGGLDVSMRAIVQSLLNAEVPTIVYVSPEGARAASAGTFITMAAHLAVMAPATSIGAATPVDLQGGEITEKIINDAVAFAVSVAERRDRDVEFAEESVRDGRSITAREAVELGVADFIASDLDDLLLQADGVVIDQLDIVLNTAGAVVERKEMSWLRSVLGRLADPNIAFILLSIGTLAVIYEAANPGLGFAGIAGIIMVILAFFALSVLPVRAAGIALFVLAVALLVAELFVPGVGVLAAGGAIALLLSGLFLFEGTLRVSPGVVWPSAVVLGAGSALASRAVVTSHRGGARSGPQTMVGRSVGVQRSGDRYLTFTDGAWWEVRSRSGELEEGSVVQVVEVEGVHLVVEEVTDDL